MCGFIALFDRSKISEEDNERLKVAGKKITHRGQDSSGFFTNRYVSFFFTRLSILDLNPRSNQPFVLEDKGLTLCFNGEIYNFKEIKEQLIILGYKFRTSSDTEVVANSYLAWGDTFVQKMRGMFAFVIWDDRKKQLIYGRDRFGIKPLYLLRISEQRYLFASEIKSILTFSKNRFKINTTVLSRYLVRNFCDDSEETFFKNIYSIKPGTLGRVNLFNESTLTYWYLKSTHNKNFDEKEFIEKFNDSLKAHSVSDVGVAATLSGGLDSTSIVGSLSLNNYTEPMLKCYTSVPPKTESEIEFVQSAVEHSKLQHKFVPSDDIDELKVLQQLLKTMDEPPQNASAIYHYILRDFVKKDNIKVLMVGEGADEILGGYRRMIFPWILSMTNNDLSKLDSNTISGASKLLEVDTKTLEILLKNYQLSLKKKKSMQENEQHYSLFNNNFYQNFKDVFLEPMYPIKEEVDENCFSNLLKHHIFKRNLPYVLKIEDRNSMASGIESRTPFVDHIFIEYVFSLKIKEFMYGGENKSMLRRAARVFSIVPDLISNRPNKLNRPGSSSYLMQGPFKEAMIDVLDSISFKFLDFFAEDLRDQFLSDIKLKRNERMDAWFRVFSTAIWFNQIEKYVEYQ